MSKTKSVAYQIRSAVRGCMRIGAQKRAEELDNPELAERTVYSYKEMEALVDTGSQFARYCAAQGVRKVRDITPALVSAWLQSKVEKGVRQETLDAYASRLGKIGACCNSHYRECSIDLHVAAPKSMYTQKLRRDAMTREQYDRVLAAMGPCSSRDALELAGAFGLRVSETTKLRPMDWDRRNGTLQIFRAKGGRTRVLPVETAAQRELLERLTRGKRPNERICPVLPDSVNKTLARTEDRVGGCENIRAQKQGIHAIRKMVAQERYDRLRAEGMGYQEALGEVTHYLGHGRNRADLAETYIINR